MFLLLWVVLFKKMEILIRGLNFKMLWQGWNDSVQNNYFEQDFIVVIIKVIV